MLRSETCFLVSILTLLRPFRGGVNQTSLAAVNSFHGSMVHGLQIDTPDENTRRRAGNVNSRYAIAWSGLSSPFLPPLFA